MKNIINKIRQIPTCFAMVCHFVILFIPSFIFWGLMNKATRPYPFGTDGDLAFIAFFAAITAGMILPVIAVLRQIIRHHLFGEENW